MSRFNTGNNSIIKSHIADTGMDIFFSSITAGVIWLMTIIFYIHKVVLPLFHTKNETKREVVLTALQAILLVLSLQNIYVQSKRFEEGTPVSHFYQTLSWITAGKLESTRRFGDPLSYLMIYAVVLQVLVSF